MAAIISCRCIKAPKLVIARAVGERWMRQRQVLGRDDGERSWRLAAARGGKA